MCKSQVPDWLQALPAGRGRLYHRRDMHLILYDGLCRLCVRSNRFVLARDYAERFQFASLQSPLGRSFAERFGVNPDHPVTVLVVSDYTSEAPRLRVKGDAVLFVLEELSAPWRWAQVLRILPRGMLDWGYDVIARRRYRLFGRYNTCPLPEPAYRTRFLES